MGYAQELMHLLKPLGVYKFENGSFSMSELESLGAQLDFLFSEIAENQRESTVFTAQDEGLRRMEVLFPFRSAAQTVEARRAAIAGFLQISGDGFTLEALRRCLAACGVECLLSEKEQPNEVRISFPGVMGIPPSIARVMQIAEEILPAHVLIEYVYRWCTWGETEQYGFTWGDVCGKTWHEWRVYTE